MKTEELSSQYQPADVEKRIYDQWLASGAFHAVPDSGVASRPRFSMVIPPPNVTGALHLGHAINGTIQDVLARYHRMKGDNTLWMPGIDHAGIATQAVVEKTIFQEEKKNRHDLGREELVRRIWQWKEKFGNRILDQLKAMGCSCDWDRTRFTLDDVCARAVREAFFKLFKDGLIFRGLRLVNWDTHLQTAVADDEIYHETVKGQMTSIRYPLADRKPCEPEYLIVATTRPETMLGDTAVAVHPDDPRYKNLIGRQVELPLVGRKIPIIADGLLVDPKFGTGVVKVTPAHDPNDYACGQRNNLPQINLLTPDGKVNASGKGKFRERDFDYSGLNFATDARKKVLEDLESLDLIADKKPHEHEVGHSDRSKTPIEPYLSEQWFIKMGDVEGGITLGDGSKSSGLAQAAIDAVKSGRVKIIPERYAQGYIDWLSQKRDWCISRQLWWGHRIPLDQDPDVLDTWFSSALWPLSTMGWPGKGTAENYEDQLLPVFYPTNVLSTAREILSLWVARMVMFGLYLHGEVPFKQVYIHAVIQDGQGRPMKKSLGNGVDPVDIIASHGADALRYTLASMVTETQDVRLPVVKDKATGRNTSPRFDVGRNFANKIWNASRFILANTSGVSVPSTPDVLKIVGLDSVMPAAGATSTQNTHGDIADRWILSRLNHAIQTVDESINGFRFAPLAAALYEFFWNDLCDWYLEIAKNRIRQHDPIVQRILLYCLDTGLRLMHPLMPYISEAIWEKLPDRSKPLILSTFPEFESDFEDWIAEAQIRLAQEITRNIRDIRNQYNVDLKKTLQIVLKPIETISALEETRGIIEPLANCALTIAPDAARPSDAAVAILSDLQIFVLGVIDRDAERQRLAKRQTELEGFIRGGQAKISNDNFVNKAPAPVVQGLRDQLAKQESELAVVKQSLAEL